MSTLSFVFLLCFVIFVICNERLALYDLVLSEVPSINIQFNSIQLRVTY